jgi:hypothetical protein
VRAIMLLLLLTPGLITVTPSITPCHTEDRRFHVRGTLTSPGGFPAPARP